MLIVRELESRIHDVLFEVGTTPVMQATSEPSGGATQPTQQIRQHTDAGGGGIRQQQTAALGGSSGGQRGRSCNPEEPGATLGGESGHSR